MKVQILSIAVIVLFTDFVMAQARGNLLARRSDRADSIRKTGEGSELLEPALTLEEAVTLAKKNDPKGYYQLAINVRQLGSLKRKDGFDSQAYSDHFLQKAVDAGYPNAIFAMTLMDDMRLASKGNTRDRNPRKSLEKYVGISLSSWRIKGSLSVPEDVSAIRCRYETLVTMGVTQATNAIADLDFRVKENMEHERSEKDKESKDDEAVKLIRSVVSLPPQKNVDEEWEKKAKAQNAVYIPVPYGYDGNVQWSTNNNCKLYFGIRDSGWELELDRVLVFSNDGRLISVSPKGGNEAARH